MRAALLLRCADAPGIVAAVGRFVADASGNIVEADQHSDIAAGLFLQRVEFDSPRRLGELREAFGAIAARFAMTWSLHDLATPGRIVVLVSNQGHCLGDLLVRCDLGELMAEAAAVISNHPTHSGLAARFDIPFHHVPIPEPERGVSERSDPAASEARDTQERALGALLDDYAPDLVILARYMRIIPAWLAARWTNQMINIHHSFLPSFAGARPYAQAHDRGVKVIGATAHYVTAELDGGPIIAQQVLSVSHRDDPARLARRGRDVESVVLAEAVRLHLERRVIVYGRRTAVFD